MMLCAISTIAGFNNILLFKGIQKSICIFNNSLPKEENTTIYSTTEHQANKLVQKNPNLWQLIDAFDLVNENGMEIRNQKTA